MRARPIAVVVVSLALAAGCTRKVVLDPSVVPARNDPAWTIRRAPAPAVAGSAAPAAAPDNPGAAPAASPPH
jgi:hypothetical protein